MAVTHALLTERELVLPHSQLMVSNKVEASFSIQNPHQKFLKSHGQTWIYLIRTDLGKFSSNQRVGLNSEFLSLCLSYDVTANDKVT